LRNQLYNEPLRDDEVHRINRAQLALKLHKFPHEIDQAPYLDMMDVQQVESANDALAARAKYRSKR
jgi:hypothetical protein